MSAPVPPVAVPPTLDLAGLPRLQHRAELDPAKMFARWAAHPTGAAALQEWGYRGPEDLDRARPWWGMFDLDQLSEVFAREELIQMWCESRVLDHFTTLMEEREPLLNKIRSSLWRHGFCDGWWRVVRALRGLRRLSPDAHEKDFEFRLTWTPWGQAYSYSLHGQALGRELYLDGPFGLLVYYRGKHVLTVGFALGRAGVLISQVQLREKRGNRWLYQLRRPYLEWALDHFRRAFYDQGLYLVTGDSTANAIDASYAAAKNPTPHLTAEQRARITAMYNRPLDGYERCDLGPERAPQYFGRYYVRLRHVTLKENPHEHP